MTARPSAGFAPALHAELGRHAADMVSDGLRAQVRRAAISALLGPRPRGGGPRARGGSGVPHPWDRCVREHRGDGAAPRPRRRREALPAARTRRGPCALPLRRPRAGPPRGRGRARNGRAPPRPTSPPGVPRERGFDELRRRSSPSRGRDPASRRSAIAVTRSIPDTSAIRPGVPPTPPRPRCHPGTAHPDQHRKERRREHVVVPDPFQTPVDRRGGEGRFASDQCRCAIPCAASGSSSNPARSCSASSSLPWVRRAPRAWRRDGRIGNGVPPPGAPPAPRSASLRPRPTDPTRGTARSSTRSRTPVRRRHRGSGSTTPSPAPTARSAANPTRARTPRSRRT